MKTETTGAGSMVDKTIITLAMLSLAVFLGVVLWFVAEPELVIVTALIFALALHDFWISVFRPRDYVEPPPPSVPLEALPTGTSGKPATRRTPAKKRNRRKK